jgi:hypothetical protein
MFLLTSCAASLRRFWLPPLQEKLSSSTEESAQRASEQARQTDRPGERAKPSSIAHHPVGSNVFQVEDGEEESSIVVVVVVVVCFLVFCLSMFFLGVFWKLSLAHFFFPNFLCVFCCFVVEIITNIALYSGGLNCV